MVMFIPQPMKTHYTKAKAYCPINLSSLMLQTTAKLVDRYMRDEKLRFYLLNSNHIAYQPGKPIETALSNVVTHTENAMKEWKMALELF